VNEWVKTGIFGGVAAIAVLAAVFTQPRRKDPEIFKEEGKPFFPNLTDSLQVASMEVVEYDELRSRPRPFKVEVKNGAWVLPTHHDHPADAAERLKKTVAQVVDLQRDSLRSDRASDHESLGVVDPLDDQAKATRGRGKRITLRDPEGSVLADFILGNDVPGGREMKYVRLPGQKWVYGVKTKAEFSAKFSDWIETDFLKVDTYDIRRLRFDYYRIEERMVDAVMRTETGEQVIVKLPVPRLHRADTFLVEKGEDYRWKIDGKEAEDAKVTEVTGALDKLSIVSVRPKPAGIAADLTLGRDVVVSGEAISSLLGKGYFLRVPNGTSIVSMEALQLLYAKGASKISVGQLVKDLKKYEVIEKNEGEDLTLEVASKAGQIDLITEKGVVYTLRFGDIATGIEEAGGEKPAGEHRWILVTVKFDPQWIPAPKPDPRPEPTDGDPLLDWDSQRSAFEKRQKEDEEWEKKSQETMKRRKEEWDQKVKDGEKAAKELNRRFANWYYVISGENFDKLQASREKLQKK